MTNEAHSGVTPYESELSKRVQVEQMFDRIAPRYDLLNRVLSLGIDQYWRRVLIDSLSSFPHEQILDLATGTGDVAIAAARKLRPEKVVATDIAAKMLDIGRVKAIYKEVADRIDFELGDAQNLVYADNTFDAITVAFGVRNFEETIIGLKECFRVLKPEGRIAILEFSQPQKFPFKNLYQFYFKHILPLIGKITSQDDKAYRYLFNSVQTFPQGEEFLKVLREAGFRSTSQRKLTLGICTLYSAGK